MKKYSIVTKERNPYEIEVLIENIELIESSNGKSGLFNINTNQIIGNLSNYYTYYSEQTKFYKQKK